MATDLLFDSGSFTISPKGLEILKKFGDATRRRTSASGSSPHRQRADRLQRTKDGSTRTRTSSSRPKRAIAVFGQLLKSA